MQARFRDIQSDSFKKNLVLTGKQFIQMDKKTSYQLLERGIYNFIINFHSLNVTHKELQKLNTQKVEYIKEQEKLLGDLIKMKPDLNFLEPEVAQLILDKEADDE